MLKKLLMIPILALSVIAFSSPVQPTSVASLEGYYAIDGTMKLSANLPGVASITLSFPDMALFEPWFDFYSDGSFGFLFPLVDPENYLLVGYWDYTGKGSSFSVDATEDLQYYVDLLAESGIEAEVTQHSFTGSVSSSGIKGKFSLAIEAYYPDMDIGGTISLSGSFVGYPTSLAGKSGSLSQKKGSSQGTKALVEKTIKLFKEASASKKALKK